MRSREAFLFALLAVGVAGTYWMVALTHGVIGEVRGIAATRQHDLRVQEAPTLTMVEPSKISLAKTVDGTLITHTCCQNEGESFDDFVRRCRREWRRVCKEFEEGGD